MLFVKMYISGLLTLDRVTRPRSDQLFVSCGMYQWKSIDCVSPKYRDEGTVSAGRVWVGIARLEPRAEKVAKFEY